MILYIDTTQNGLIELGLKDKNKLVAVKKFSSHRTQAEKLLPAIEKAIQNSSLGLAPIADKDTVRLSIPQLTEERRKELVKTLGKFLEEARIKVRRDREDCFREVDRREKAKEISEDEKFRRRNEAQKLVDETNKKIEELGKNKEKEIMTV